MSEAKPLTALEILADRSSTAIKASNRCRDDQRDDRPTRTVTAADCHMAEAVAFNDAYLVMKRELERLKNLWQNGSLTIDSFNV